MRLQKFPHSHTQLAAAISIAAAFLFASPPGAAADDDAGPMAMAPAPIPAPAIDLPCVDGTPFSLASRKGKFTLINFWALWCAPCRAEMPALARLKNALAHTGLEVVAVNLGDKPEAVARFMKQVDTGRIAVVLDRTGETGKAWHVQGLPATFLVAPDGTITHAALGARDWAAGGSRRWFEKTISDARP